MFKICVGLILLIQEVVLWEQHDYILTVERGEVLTYNKSFLGFAKINNFKYNRTHVGINGTINFKRDYGNAIKVTVQGYKFASNEYRLFPLEFNRNLCSSLQTNEFGLQNLYAYGNFTGCPMKKGTYMVRNWSPDFSKFPPYIPGGRYRMDLKLIYLENEMLHGQAFGTVTPIKDISPP